MILAARESEIYFSIASLSGVESEYNLPLGGDVPGNKSIAQSLGWCWGIEAAWDLLNTPFRLRYSRGTVDRSAWSSWNTEQDTGEHADNKQEAWQYSPQANTASLPQFMWGLWSMSQGCPRTTGAAGVLVKRKSIFSACCPEVMCLKEAVTCVTKGKDWPFSATTEIGWDSATTGILRLWRRPMSKKLPSAPESLKPHNHKSMTASSALTEDEWLKKRICWG